MKEPCHMTACPCCRTWNPLVMVFFDNQEGIEDTEEFSWWTSLGAWVVCSSYLVTPLTITKVRCQECWHEWDVKELTILTPQAEGWLPGCSKVEIHPDPVCAMERLL